MPDPANGDSDEDEKTDVYPTFPTATLAELDETLPHMLDDGERIRFAVEWFLDHYDGEDNG